MQESSVLTWITAISSIATPILLLILSAFFANMSRTQEKIQMLQEKLQDDRIDVYNTILEPYIIVATPDPILHKQKKYQNKTSGDVASEMVVTPEYKRAEFKLFLIGSDAVVIAYNELKKFFYAGGIDGSLESTKKALTLTATLVLEIRKSVGNENTKLSYQDAAWWFVKDVDKFF